MKSTKQASERAFELRAFHNDTLTQRRRMRDLGNGGASAVKALLGDIKGAGIDMPVANLVLSGNEKLGQKLGVVPDVRVDPPITTDSEKSRRDAERLERIVQSFDDGAEMDLAYPQAGRWLPGYAFVPWIIREQVGRDGFRYPHAELRDPYDCYPAPWGVQQQPLDVVFWRNVPIDTLKRTYGVEIEDKIRPKRRFPGGAVDLAGRAGVARSDGGWEGSTRMGDSVEIAEYYDIDGRWLLHAGSETLLDFVPNLLEAGPQFVISKKYSFDKLIGAYDESVGLLAMMAKLNLLAQIGMEDAVFAETNIFGEPQSGPYRRGRFAHNVFPAGTTVQKMQSNLPYQAFEQINRIERQLRTVSSYPVTDDAQSPMSFVTGAGLDELTTPITTAIREYQLVFRRTHEKLDAKRLEWAQKAYGGKRRPLVGHGKGEPYAETYDPSWIKGRYTTRRVFGMMAGWDEPQKIVAGLQLRQDKIISRQTFRENLAGLDNIVREGERVEDEEARDMLFQTLMSKASEGDPRAIMAAVEMQPESELKEVLRKFFTPQEPAMSEGEMAMAGMGAPEPPQPTGPPPPVGSVLAQLTAQGGSSRVTGTI